MFNQIMKEIAATECRYVAYILILSSNQTLDMPIRQHLKVEGRVGVSVHEV